MAKAKSGSSNTNRSGPTKAGKSSGAWQAPPAPKPEKRAARLAGEQQFQRDKNDRITRLPDEDKNAAVLDTLAAMFGVKRRPHQAHDTGYRMDEDRGRIVLPYNNDPKAEDGKRNVR